MKFKALLLDLDGTLYDYYPAHGAGMEAAVRLIEAVCPVGRQAILDAISAGRAVVHARLRGTAASHNRLLYFQLACEKLGLNPFPLAHQCYRAHWDNFIATAPFYDGVMAFLDACSGTPVVLVTDLTADVQYEKIAAMGLSSRITAMVTSEEAGVEKPDARIFELALSKINVAAQDACMIGDDWEKDVVGAAALGITPVWFNPLGKAPEILRINELKSCGGAVGDLPVRRGGPCVRPLDGIKQFADFHDLKGLLDHA